MCIDVVFVLRLGVFKHATEAARSLASFHVNRKKVTAVQEWWDASPHADLRQCPQQFVPGRAFQAVALRATKGKQLHWWTWLMLWTLVQRRKQT